MPHEPRRILDLMAVGAKVLADGHECDITGQIDAYNWNYLRVTDTATGSFGIDHNQMEDEFFYFLDR